MILRTSFGPEYVADELRRPVAEFSPAAGSAPQHVTLMKGPQPRKQFGITMVPMHLRGQKGTVVDQCHLTLSCFTQLFGWNMIKRQAHVRMRNPIDQLCDRVRTMEANMETLRTRLTQVADLRDAQGLREGQRVLTHQTHRDRGMRFRAYSQRIHD